MLFELFSLFGSVGNFLNTGQNDQVVEMKEVVVKPAVAIDLIKGSTHVQKVATVENAKQAECDGRMTRQQAAIFTIALAVHSVLDGLGVGAATMDTIDSQIIC